MNRFYTALIILIFLFSCANQKPPSGGEPDTTPPEITETYPNNGTLNFKDNSVSLWFNKYVVKNQVVENIFIVPAVKTEFDWSGKKLEIDFLEDLMPNTTYSVSIGTDYTDYYDKNKPDRAYTIIFSTGSNLDSGKVHGKIYEKDPSGIFVYLIRIDNIDPDTLDISKNIPIYRTQAGKTGEFEINALKDGIYRIFTVKDKFKNDIYDPGIDEFSAGLSDITVTKDKPAKAVLRIGPPIDKTGPAIYTAEALAEDLIIIRFSEPVSAENLSGSSFNIKDSLGLKNIETEYAWISPENNQFVMLSTKQILDTNTVWMVSGISEGENVVKDTLGNPLQDTANVAFFNGNFELDTTKPALSFITIKDSAKNISVDPEILLRYNIPVDTALFAGNVILFNNTDSLNIAIKLEFPTVNSLSIKPGEELKGDTWYKLEIPFNEVTGYNGRKTNDTARSVWFKTKDIRSYGDFSGILKNEAGWTGSFLIQITSDDGKTEKITKVDKTGKWLFRKIEPLEYTIMIFNDSNNNGEYDFGTDIPYSFSEKFFIFPEKVKINPRWGVEDAVLTIPADK